MTVQTLRDIYENRGTILARLNAGSGPEKLFFNRSVLKGPVVWNDEVARLFLETCYRLNTQFVPGMHPGTSMAIGDIVEFDGDSFLTMNINVMMANVAMLHSSRSTEPLMELWDQSRDGLIEEVEALHELLLAQRSHGFDTEMFKPAYGWRYVDIGMSSIEAPRKDFLDELNSLLQRIAGKDGFKEIHKKAKKIADAITDLVNLPEILYTIRKEARHKGYPYIHEGIMHLSSPAASGGASMVIHGASDDLMRGIPNSSQIIILAGQTGHAAFTHIGGGTLQGHGYSMIPPASPFFDEVQKRIDADTKFADEWKWLGSNEIEYPWSQWTKLTQDTVAEVTSGLVPELLRDRVLGFYVDLREANVAELRPVISQSHLDTYGFEGMDEPRHVEYETVLIEDTRGYYKAEDILKMV